MEDVPLREWLEEELKSSDDKRLIIRKTTVAYAASELLQKAIKIAPLSADKIILDNFVVRTKMQHNLPSSAAAIVGVDMISEKLSSTIIDPSDDGRSPLDSKEDGGRNVVIAITSTLPGSNAMEFERPEEFEQMEESEVCHHFGILLYQIYSNLDPFPEKNLEASQSAKGGLRLTYSTLHELGSPPNICMLVQNLAECRSDNLPCPPNAYSSLKQGSDDLHLLLLQPNRFLFTSNAFEGGQLHRRLKLNKLYGRDHEVSLIRDAFANVCTGDNVALFIGGFSGSGKTSLVETVMESVHASGGYVLSQKFNKLCRGGPLLELTAAFDRLCILIRNNASPEDQSDIVDRLTRTFGPDLSLLRRLLPEVDGLVPALKKLENQSQEDDINMNLQSICFILTHFLRAVSSKSHPVMIFLDDLQWCNNMTLEVIQHILCDDASEGSCCLFVGSYRSNEVTSDHAVFRLMKELEQSKVSSVQKLTLDGVKCEDLNVLISDALCLFPRLTQCLSSIIHEKTEGNPFFFLEFLRSLVDRDLLQYSLSSEQWEWDEDLIRLEKITNNVLYLLANKMSKMPKNVQMALKVLSSFGNKVNEEIVVSLNTSFQFSNIVSGLEEAISDGFVSRMEEPPCYAFVHDKVKEAAYSLIPDDQKDSFHCMLGEALRSIQGDSFDDTTAITIADQMNHNLPALKQRSASMRLEVADLNKIAGLAAMSRSDYETASSYLSTSLQLLPDGHWQSSYRLSLETYMAMAKVAYSRGDHEKLVEALKTIFNEAKSLEDKLDAYYLYVNHLHSQERGEEAHMTCQGVLNKLGENIPEYVTPLENKKIIEETVLLISGLSEEKLLEMKESGEKSQQVMRFICLMGTVSYFSKPELLPYLNLRSLKLTLEFGLSKYSLVGLVGNSIILCNSSTLPKECVQLGFKVGAIGISLLRSHFDYSDMKAAVDHSYSYVLQHTDPVQKCAERARTGFGFGIASGDTVFAFLNANGEIRYSILAGANLPDLLCETDKYLALVGHHGNTLSRFYLLIYRETISTLIDNGENTSRNKEDGEQKVTSEGDYLDRHYETLSFHKVLQSFWLGHQDRCYHYSEKLLENKQCGKHHRLVTLFYHCLNSFVMLRKGKYTKRCSQVYKIAHKALKEAEEMSRWNYRNKVLLLEAEKYSYQGLNNEARNSYGAAIMAARTSRFVHEQGLACELSAFHCQRTGDFEQARKFFDRAKICYDQWGSLFKVEFISNETDQMSCSGSDTVEERGESAQLADT